MDDTAQRSQRFTIHQLVEIQFSQGTFFQAEGINLSESGVLCSTESLIEPYSKVFIMLEMPLREGQYTLKTEGTVVRCEKVAGEYQVGVRFDNLFQSEKEKLQEYLEVIEKGL